MKKVFSVLLQRFPSVLSVKFVVVDKSKMISNELSHRSGTFFECEIVLYMHAKPNGTFFASSRFTLLYIQHVVGLVLFGSLKLRASFLRARRFTHSRAHVTSSINNNMFTYNTINCGAGCGVRTFL